MEGHTFVETWTTLRIGLVLKIFLHFNHLVYYRTVHFHFKTQATLFHYACAIVNQELLCLKLPSPCLPVVFTRSSGISHSPSTMSKRVPWISPCEWYFKAYLPFAPHLPVAILNDGLFLNRPRLMMSNPEIPSNTVFVLSYSRATSFHSCLPCFTLTGTACLPPRRQWDWWGLTNAALGESQCHETTHRRTAKKKKKKKGKGAVTPRGRPSHSSTPQSPPLHPLLPHIYANSLCWERTQGDALLKIDGTISPHRFFKNAISHSRFKCWGSWGEPGVWQRLGTCL